jgi:putative Mg2+ transporter-C (MgtC) family protein
MQLSPDWQSVWHDVGRLLAAYIFALPIGWYRETETHSVGVRTFPLVAIASCGYVLLASPEHHNSIDAQSRVLQGLVAGMGFIGGGAILHARGNVHGTAAAASIWNMGVVGAAVAEDRYFIAGALALVNLFALRVLLPIKESLDRRADKKHPTDSAQ